MERPERRSTQGVIAKQPASFEGLLSMSFQAAEVHDSCHALGPMTNPCPSLSPFRHPFPVWYLLGARTRTILNKKKTRHVSANHM